MYCNFGCLWEMYLQPEDGKVVMAEPRGTGEFCVLQIGGVAMCQAFW